MFYLQGISFVKPHPRQRKRQPVTNPTLFGGFQQQKKSSLKSPERPTRPVKPEPIYKKKPTFQPNLHTHSATPTFKPSTVTISPIESSSTSYDPFSFQSTDFKSTTPQERNDYDIFDEEIEDLKDSITENGHHSVRQISVTPHSLSVDNVTPHSLAVDDSGSTVVPVFVTSDYPELRRVPKNAQSGGPPPISENEIEPR